MSGWGLGVGSRRGRKKEERKFPPAVRKETVS